MHPYILVVFVPLDESYNFPTTITLNKHALLRSSVLEKPIPYKFQGPAQNPRSTIPLNKHQKISTGFTDKKQVGAGLICPGTQQGLVIRQELGRFGQLVYAPQNPEPIIMRMRFLSPLEETLHFDGVQHLRFVVDFLC